MNSILKYATDQEIADLRGLKANEAALKAEHARIHTEIRNVQMQISERMRKAPAMNLEAARALLGNTAYQSAPAPEYSSNRTIPELQQLNAGLRQLVAENESGQRYARDLTSSGLSQLMRVCTERAAEDYVAAAEHLVSAYRLLSTQDGMWPDISLRKLFIPCNSDLAAMKKYVERYALEVMYEGQSVGACRDQDVMLLQAETGEMFG